MPSLAPPVRPLFAVLLLALAAPLVGGCDTAETSLYNPDAPTGDAPVVESVSPSGVVLAGIDEVTISGRNFSATPSDNIVTFDDGKGASARATVLEASPTLLKVRVPNLPNAALRLRVSVLGAVDFSAPFALPLASATTPFGDLDTGSGEAAYGIATDASGLLYASLGRTGSSIGIFTIGADGKRVPYFTTSSVWADLAVAPNQELFGVRQLRALFRLPKGGAQETFVVLPNGVILSAVAAAPNGDLWTGGSNAPPTSGSLYRIKADKSTTSYPFTPTVRDLAVSGNALYVASVDGTTSQVWRFPFDATGGIGSGTMIYDVSAALGTQAAVTSVAVASDGTVFVGTTAADPVAQVPSSGAASSLYPGVLIGPASAITWAKGSKLYVTRDPTAPLPVGVKSADPLYLLETRRPGPH